MKRVEEKAVAGPSAPAAKAEAKPAPGKEPEAPAHREPEEPRVRLKRLEEESARLTARLKEMEEERDRLRRENAEQRERALRARADYDNLVKRSVKESQETVRTVKAALLLRVTSLVEGLESLGKDLQGRLGPDAKGFLMVLEEARRLLRDEGVREIPGKGQPFNFRFHQAVERVETNDAPEGTIVEVLQRGYQWGEDVLRPALVRVATPPRRPGTAPAGAT